jgi:hypothetical protein
MAEASCLEQQQQQQLVAQLICTGIKINGRVIE